MFPSKILVLVKSSSKGLNPLTVVVALQSANVYMKSDTLLTTTGVSLETLVVLLEVAAATEYKRLSPSKSTGKNISAFPGFTV
jgi:hypothetical protein